jgi:hypothetical protein
LKSIHITIFEFIAVLSSVGVVAWIISDLFGGMIIFLLSYPLLIIPFLLLFIISFIETLVSLFRKGKRVSKIKVRAHSAVILSVILLNVYYSDVFKSDRVLTAVLVDDLSMQRLVFRENGDVENQINGAFGFKKTFYGSYFFEDSLIIFTKTPYDNSFLPDTLCLDESQNAIFIGKKIDGTFDKEKEWLNHFEIES